jgi:alpha-ketoglutaric semialdehyde dehydrogenase
MLTGKHLIAGDWVAGDATFKSEPAHGDAHDFSVGTPAHVDAACQGGRRGLLDLRLFLARRSRRLPQCHCRRDRGARRRNHRHRNIGDRSAGSAPGRRARPHHRAVRLFASHIEKGDYLDRRHDEALPDRQPLPRPDLRMIQRPIGPVAVFGASNFPLAFSTAGGDTAAALAAGCPVVVKGHSAHPGTGEIVAQAIDAAIKKLGVHPGVFSLIQGGKRDVGQSAGHPSADQGGRLHRFAGRRTGAVRPLRRSAPSRSRSSANWARSTRCSCCLRRSRRAARRSPRAGPAR